MAVVSNALSELRACDCPHKFRLFILLCIKMRLSSRQMHCVAQNVSCTVCRKRRGRICPGWRGHCCAQQCAALLVGYSATLTLRCNFILQKAQEADLHKLAGALLDYETLSTAEIRQAC